MKNLLVLFTCFSLLFSSCDQISGLGATKISTLLEKGNSYDGKSVTVKGKVIEAMNLLLFKFYVVDDGSGQIHVVTKKALPSTGDEVLVKGKFTQVFKVQALEVSAIVENE